MCVHFIDLKIMNNCEINIYIKDSNSRSSVVNEAIKSISSQFISFFFEKILNVQEASKHKITNFPLLEIYMREKLFPLLFFVCFFVFLLVGFGLICVFARSKSFRKKIVLIAPFTILMTCTPINPPIENLFVRTYFYL